MAHRRSDDPYAQDAYYHRNPTSWEPTEPAGPPPRRSKSERKPARPSPDDRGASRRHREEDAPRGSSHRQGDARRPQSPPPPYHYEDRRGGDSRHDPRNTRDARDPRDARDSRDPREVRDPRGSRDLRDARDVRDSRSTRPEPPRGDRHEDPHRHQRNKTAEDPGRYRRSSPDHRSSKEYLPRDDRDQARRGGAAYTKSRGRDPSPSHAGRPKTRSSTDDVGRDRHIGHSSRAQGKDKPSSRDLATTEPPRGRDKHASSGTRGVGVGGIAAKVRSSTMPAAEKAAGWWKNPAIQASARTALTAGAAAAMNNRGAKGEWIGAKGVKVGFAALSAALASGGLDSVKRDDGGSGGGGRDRDRGRSSSRDRGRGRSTERGKDKSSGRSKSEGLGGGDYKQKIMQTGLDYFMKKAAAGR